jgi:hypothetical protein
LNCSGRLIPAINTSGEPIFAISWLAYRYQLFAAELDKLHILALSAEIGFVAF